MFISNNRASFYLCLKENLVKHQKVSKYYQKMIVVFGRAEYKDKVPDVSDSHENIGTLRKSKLNLRIESIVKLLKGE